MKIRNLLIASITAYTFMSCSADDLSENIPQEPVEALISFASSTALQTKSDGAALQNEDVVKELTALVFDTDGKFVKRKDTTATTHIDRITNILVKVVPAKDVTTPSETKFRVVLIANAKEQLGAVNNLSDLYNGTILPAPITAYNISNVVTGKRLLPMASEIFIVGGILPKSNNWFKTDDVSTRNEGDAQPVLLNRLVARVEMESLIASFKDDPTYAKASFEVDSIYLVNVRATALYLKPVGGTTIVHTNAPYYRGGPAVFNPEDGLVNANSAVDPLLLATFETPIRLTAVSNPLLNNFQCYIYPNTADGTYKTRVVITGLYRFSADQKPVRKYFHVVLDDASDPNTYVKQNHIYKLNVAVTGEGSPTVDRVLDNAGLNINISTTPWNVKNQTEEDEN